MDEFEKYPELAAYIEEMASTGKAPTQWSRFIWALNDALENPLNNSK